MRYNPESPPVGGSDANEYWNLARPEAETEVIGKMRNFIMRAVATEEAARWQIGFAFFDGPRSPSERIHAVEWLPESDDRILRDPRIQRTFEEHAAIDIIELVAVGQPFSCEASQDTEFRHLFYNATLDPEAPQSIECLFCGEVLQK